MVEVQLIYVSVPVQEVSIATSEFIPVAEVENRNHNITGLLVSGPSFYLQVLEGPRLSVSQLYKNILKDNRHTSPVLLRYTEIKHREFENWSMVHMTEDELRSSYISPTMLPQQITPSSISGIQAITLLRRIYILLKQDGKLEQLVSELKGQS